VRIRTWLLGAATVATLVLRAEIVPVSPTRGTEIPLVPEVQKRVMSLPAHEERLELLRRDLATAKTLHNDPNWRKASPVVLKWTVTAGEKGPWQIRIGKKADLSDARVWFKTVKASDAVTGRRGGKDGSKVTEAYEVPYANLEIGTTYYWQVRTREQCGFWACGSKHGCAASKIVHASSIASFRTEDVAPRWIELEGRVQNVRDLGGRKTVDGYRVRQGMVFRGQALNEASVSGEVRGRNRLTVADVEYMTKTLGIRTDVDQRGPNEVADMTESPLGPSVKWIHSSSECYAYIFSKGGMAAMAKNFRVFCDRANYPVYFHCSGGADRAGSLAYVLGGVLGVSRHGLETDWESTFYPMLSEMRPGYRDHSYWSGAWHFDDGFAKYGNPTTPLHERIRLYLLACGVTAKEIETFRSIMLEWKEE